MTFLGVIAWALIASGALVMFVNLGDGVYAGVALYCALASIAWPWRDS